MNLNFNIKIARHYKSKSQIARVLSEDWVLQNSYCPSCGKGKLYSYDNNKPVADFYCVKCNSDFELKSKSNPLGKKVLDGAYQTMIDRITSYNIPSFFFLNYTNKYRVDNFLVIPNHFFSPELIEKRRPLAQNARRAGWVGCNILFGSLPEICKIYLLKKSRVIPKKEVLNQWNKTIFLKQESIQNRGWIIDIIGCIDKIPNNEFVLSEIYGFESYLKKKYPRNKFIKEKIRQQLQVLRDKGMIKFLGQGKYRKL